MPFGRVQGIALFVLGVLLLGALAMISFSPRQLDARSELSARPVRHNLALVPGIVGSGALLMGIVLIYTAQRRRRTRT